MPATSEQRSDVPLKSPTLRLRLRSGINVPDWLGMIFGTPEAIPNHAFAHLQNAIHDGSSVSSRPGAQQACDSVTGPIDGFCDAGDIGAAVNAASDDGGGSGDSTADRYLYFTGQPSLGDDENPRKLFRFDTEEETLDEQTIPPVTPAHIIRGLTKGSDGKLYAPGGALGGGVVAAEVVRVLPDPGSPPTVEVVFQNSGATTEPGFGADGPTVGLDGANLPFAGWGLTGSMIEDPAEALKFFAARPYDPSVGTQTQDGKVWRDGVLDDTPSFVSLEATPKFAANMGYLNGTVYSAWGGISGRAMTDTIRKRNGPNSWANLTMPAAPFGHFAAVGNPVNIFGKLYVSGFYRTSLPAASDYRAAYLSVNASDVVTREELVPTSVQTKTVPVNNAAFNGKLYYVISDDQFGFCSLGMFNGTTWDGEHWDCMISGVFHRMLGIRIAKGELWAVAHTGEAILGNVVFYLIHSTGTDTQTWTRALQLPGTPFPLVDLVGLDT